MRWKKCSECGRFLAREQWDLALCGHCYNKMRADNRLMDPRVSAMRIAFLFADAEPSLLDVVLI